MTQPTVLYHVSDLHFGYEDRAALDWFAAEVARERPAAVICTGDLTMRGSAREYAAAAQWLAALPVPVSLEPGNHDVPYYHHMVRRLTRPYARYHALEAELESEIVLPDVTVIPLKTVARAQFRLNWSKGRVSTGDLDSALRGLAQHAACPVRLVACHHPLVEADTHSTASTRGGKRALAALARAGATAVLSGHVHDPFDQLVELDGQTIRIIGAGTLSQRLRTSQPCFNRLELGADGALDVRVQTLD
ncbi:metallophosphoesterase [Novosphingobium sp.]|uniref:metallophosphoesterase family protein n=1 Tax=Novosphingobium sp. TaxID=1874826 RepID=UPI002734C508|nr:metallophosphoesterase [Novosphingobium sp.]MDP3906294.1 metallophosphoesterase [Novosphingobium sp.]